VYAAFINMRRAPAAAGAPAAAAAAPAPALDAAAAAPGPSAGAPAVADIMNTLIAKAGAFIDDKTLFLAGAGPFSTELVPGHLLSKRAARARRRQRWCGALVSQALVRVPAQLARRARRQRRAYRPSALRVQPARACPGARVRARR